MITIKLTQSLLLMSETKPMTIQPESQAGDVGGGWGPLYPCPVCEQRGLVAGDELQARPRHGRLADRQTKPRTVTVQYLTTGALEL